jgi:outer membrane lipoprotein-sorting protein
MSIRQVALWALTASVSASFLPPVAQAQTANPDLAQILEQNAAARGGLEAWRKVLTMVWAGHAERADGTGPRPPFLLEQKRPNLTRFEIVVDKQKSVRVFDGKQGWKVRASANGRPEVQPYTDDEQRAARDALVIDGPVLDATSKGIALTLDGPDEVEGRKAWRLKAKLPSGATQRVWIDAETFLEVKYDRPARDAAGLPVTAPVYLRNYQTFEGLRMPFIIETGTPGGGAVAHRLVIDRIAINVVLPDGMFARPGLRTSRRGITVDTRSGPPGPNQTPPGLR